MKTVVKYLKMLGNIILYFGSFYLIASQSWRLIKLNKGLNDFIFQNSFLYIAFSCLIGFLVYLLIFRLKKDDFFQFCGFRKIPWPSAAMLGLLAVAMIGFTIFFVNLPFIIKSVPEFEGYMAGMDSGNFWLVALCLLMIPTFEEIMLRGLLFNELRKYMPLMAAFIIQLGVYAYMQANIPVAIYAVIGGIFYTLAYLWTNSLWASIIIQAISAVGIFVLQRTGIEQGAAKLPEGILITAATVSIIVIFMGMGYLHKKTGAGG